MGCEFVSRGRATRCPTTPGKGARQRSLKQWAARSDTPREESEVAWYGGRKKNLLLFSRTALWHRPGQAPVAIRYVMTRDPEGKLRDEVFASTKLDATPARIIEWVVMRWSVETAFEEAREHLGPETRAPMERLGDLAHDALPVGPVFAGRPCSPIACNRTARCRY